MKRQEPPTATSDCAICMEPFSASGKHRVVALRCGHLFGRGCVTEWIDSKKNAGCPLCKEKVRKRDLRNIYSVTVTAVQADGLADELRDTRRELNALAMRYDRLAGKYEALKQTMQQYVARQGAAPAGDVGVDVSAAAGLRLERVAQVDLLSSGRVMHHAQRDSSLLVGKGGGVERSCFHVR